MPRDAGCWRGGDRDVFERLAFVRPGDVRLLGSHRNSPLAFFNGSVAPLGGEALILARAVLGYYRYVSVLVEAVVPLEEIASLRPGSRLRLEARIAVEPLDHWGFWGVEDPRLAALDEALVAVYTGRTRRYFESGETVNIVSRRAPGGEWLREGLLLEAPPGTHVSEKNGFLARLGGVRVAATRVHERAGRFRAVIGRASQASWGIRVDATDYLEPLPGEEKVGWSTPGPPAGRSLIVLAHAVTSNDGAYKLLALKVEETTRGPKITGHSRGYIMKPVHPLERHGDRPLTIYPTGAIEIDGYTYITYGAGDISLGIARVETQQLLEAVEECS